MLPFESWNAWRTNSLNGPIYKLLVLFELIKSPTYEFNKWVFEKEKENGQM